MRRFPEVWLTEDEEDLRAVDTLMHRPEIIGGMDYADDPEFSLMEIANWYAWVVPGVLGAFLVCPTGDNEAELHMGVLPEARGLVALRAGRRALEYELGVGHRLVGRTPICNLAARRFAALCGGRVVGVEDGEEVRLWVA